MPDAYDDLLDSVLPKPSRTDGLIRKHATRTGLDPEFVRRVVGQESQGNPNARSWAGAEGLGQLMPGTARRYKVKNPRDPDENLRGATDYLKDLTAEFKEPEKVLAAYNAGEGRVRRLGYKRTRTLSNLPKGDPRRGGYQGSTGEYVDKILKGYTPQQKKDEYDSLLDGVMEPKPKDEYDTLLDDVAAQPVPGRGAVYAANSFPSLAGTTVRPMRRRLTGGDAVHHLGVDPAEMQNWNPKVRARALEVIQDAVTEDERKRAAKEEIGPTNLSYQNDMRRKAGLPPITKSTNLTGKATLDAALGPLPRGPQSQVIRPTQQSPSLTGARSDDDVLAQMKVQVAGELAPQGEPRLFDSGAGRTDEINAEAQKRFVEYKASQAADVAHAQSGGNFMQAPRESTAMDRVKTALGIAVPAIGLTQGLDLSQRDQSGVDETLRKYAPGLASIDTPMGVKSDPIRGAVRGLTLGAVGDQRQITPDEKLIDPDAETKRDVGEFAGSIVGGVAPYIAAGKAFSAISALNKVGRGTAAVRTGATFGSVETVREAINSARTGDPFRPEEVIISTAIGAAMGAIPGANAGMVQRIVAATAPQAAVDYARGVPLDQAVLNGLINVGFEMTSGRITAPKELKSGAKGATVPVETQERLARGARAEIAKSEVGLGGRLPFITGESNARRLSAPIEITYETPSGKTVTKTITVEKRQQQLARKQETLDKLLDCIHA